MLVIYVLSVVVFLPNSLYIVKPITHIELQDRFLSLVLSVSFNIFFAPWLGFASVSKWSLKTTVSLHPTVLNAVSTTSLGFMK